VAERTTDFVKVKVVEWGPSRLCGSIETSSGGFNEFQQFSTGFVQLSTTGRIQFMLDYFDRKRINVGSGRYRSQSRCFDQNRPTPGKQVVYATAG
jgi:hypothetical protein